MPSLRPRTVRPRLALAYVCAWTCAALVVLAAAGAGSANAATAFDLSGCTGAALQIPADSGSGSVTTADCTIGFGSTSSAAQLRIRQTDGVGSAMYAPGSGNLDIGFDGDASMPCYPCNGTIMTPLAGQDTMFSLTAQPDGMTVFVAGTTSQVVVRRVTATGALDATFDGPTGAGDGTVVLTPPRPGQPHILHSRVLPDGRIVLAGYTMYAGQPENVLIIRLRPDGTPDPAFSGDGYAQFDLSSVTSGTGPYTDMIEGMAIGPDGAVVAAGCMTQTSPADWCSSNTRFPFVVRITGGGTLDTRFGTGGIWFGRPTGANGDSFEDVTVAPSGRIITAGNASTGDVLVTALTPAGALDSTFNGTGFRTVDLGGASDAGRSIDLDPSGRIVVGARGAVAGVDAYAAIRLLANGTLDTSFGTGGVVEASLGAAGVGDDMENVLALSDGRVLIGGYVDGTYGSSIAEGLAMFTSSGVLDATFDGDGLKTIDTQGGATFEHMHSLDELPDGRIVGAGGYDTGDMTPVVSMLTAVGTLPQYANGTTDFDQGSGAFGACLRSVGATASATWTPNATCPMTDGAWWNAVPAGTGGSVVARVPGASVTPGSASLRFGARGGTNAPGAYVAPVTIEVVAPEITAPANAGVPTISGQAQVNRTLRADVGTWTGSSPMTYGYQWRRCDSGGANCVDIAGATNEQYVLQGADQGQTVRVVVTATNDSGSASATSAATAVVTAPATTNVVFTTGFEHQTLSSAGGGLSFGVLSGQSIDTTTPRTGAAALRSVATTAWSSHWKSPLFTASGTITARFYVRYEDFGTGYSGLGAGACGSPRDNFFQVSDGTNYLGLSTTTSGYVCTQAMDSPRSLSTSRLKLDTWHLIDVRVTTNVANTYTIDYSIDGVSQPSGTRTGMVNTSGLNRVFLGPDGATGDGDTKMFFDDLVVSSASSSYPIGPGKVVAYRPASIKAISDPTKFDWSTNNGGAFTAFVAGDANQTPGRSTLVDEWPVTTGGTADVIRQNAITGSPTLRLGLEQSTESTAPDAVSIVAGARSTGGPNATLKAWDGASSSTPINSTLTASLAYYGSTLGTAPGANPWTVARFNNLQLELSSTNASPNPLWDAILAEVDYPTAFPLRNLAPPVVTGTNQVGSTLSATTGAWDAIPSAFRYTWYACTAPAGTACTQVGTNSSTYTVLAGDAGKLIKVLVGAQNSAGWQTAAGWASGTVHSATPTLDRVNGFEYGSLATPTGLVQGTTGAVSVERYAARSGNFSARVSPAMAAANVRETTFSTTATQVLRVAIMFDQFPTTNAEVLSITSDGGNTVYVRIDPLTYKLTAGWNATGVATSTTTLQRGRWYVIDLIARANIANESVDWAIDGVVQPTSLSGGNTATTFNNRTITLGTTVATDTYVAQYDDLAYSAVAADYPIGLGTVQPLLPSATGTHTTPGNYRTGTGGPCTTVLTAADSDVVSGSNLFLGDWPPATGGAQTRVCQSNTSGTMEYRLQDTTQPNAPQAIRAYAAMSEAVASTSNLVTQTLVVDDGATRTDNYVNNVDILSGNTIVYQSKTYARVPVTNNPWTNTILDTARLRFTATTSSNAGFPATDALLVEAAYPTDSTATNTVQPEVSTVTGSAQVGSLLVATRGTWNEPVNTSWSWVRCDSGASNCTLLEGPSDDGTYTAVAGDLGKALYLVERADDGNGAQVAWSEPVYVTDSTFTPTFLTGFEHGITTSGNGYWAWNWNQANFSIVPGRTGGNALRSTSVASGALLARGGIGAASVVTARFYVRPTTFDNTAIAEFNTTNGSVAVHGGGASYDRLAVRLYDGGVCGWQNMANPIAAGQWHRVDLRMNLAGSMPVVEWMVDGIAQPTYTAYDSDGAGANCDAGARTTDELQLGNSNVVTVTTDYDDIAVSTDANDFPIGPGRVQPLAIDGTGTHNTPGNYRNNGGGAIDGTSCGRLDEPAFTFTDWVQQTTVGTGTYLECSLSNAPSTQTARAISAVVAYSGSGTAGAWVRDNVNNTDLAVRGRPGALAAYAANGQATAILTPPGGGWTPTVVDALTARVGGGSAITPQWHGFVLEAEYPDP